MMQDLSIDAQSPEQRTLRSYSRALQQTTQAPSTLLPSTQAVRQSPATSLKRDREVSESPPDERADPLSMLAYAGRIVGRDSQKPP